MPVQSQPAYLSTAKAAELLAVSVSSVKRWVNEGVLPAHVTAGGHRKLLRSEVLALARQTNLPTVEAAGVEGHWLEPDAVRSTLQEALVRGRGAQARLVLRNAYDLGMSPETLADQVIAPAMRNIGHDWERERLEIWQEHRSTQLCAAAVADLKHTLESRAERNRPVAIGGAPEGDHYTLATQLAQLVLLDYGWEAINVGPNTPFTSLTMAMRELRPKLIWLSVSYLRDSAEFIRTYREFYRSAERQGVAVAIGGQALAEKIRKSMVYSTYGEGLNVLAGFARTLHPRPRRPRRGRPRGSRG